MTTHHPPLTIDDHMHLGNLLKDVRCSLSWLLRHSAVTSKLGRDAMRVITAIDQLRSSLDDRLYYQAPPSHDPRRIAPLVYFGEQRFHLRSYDPDEMEADVFASWTAGY
jgi:hypothetical protein